MYIAFQPATDYRAPVWPPVDGEKRRMTRFHSQVGDLASAVADKRSGTRGLARRPPTAGERPSPTRPGRPPVLPLPRRRLTQRAPDSSTVLEP